MIMYRADDDKIVQENKKDLNRLVNAYNHDRLTWHEYLHQVIFSAQRALQSELEKK